MTEQTFAIVILSAAYFFVGIPALPWVFEGGYRYGDYWMAGFVVHLAVFIVAVIIGAILWAIWTLTGWPCVINCGA